MARNRKYQSAANRFGPALKAGLLCLLIGGAGVGYVWQKDQIARLGKQVLVREKRLDDLQKQNEKLRTVLGGMRSPAFLEASIKKYNLGLVPPQPTQVWRLGEPLPEMPAPPSGRQVAERGSRVMTQAMAENP